MSSKKQKQKLTWDQLTWTGLIQPWLSFLITKSKKVLLMEIHISGEMTGQFISVLNSFTGVVLI